MNGIKTLINILITLAAIIFAGALTACVYDEDEPEYSLAPGEPLPDFSVTLLNGEVFSTAGLPGSGIANLLIVFFNTDCSDCQHDLPLVQELYDEILADETLGRNTRLICVAREEDAASVRNYWEANNLTLPVSPQPDRTIYNLFASIGIPRLYLAQPSSDSTFIITAAYAPDEFTISSLSQLLRYE